MKKILFFLSAVTLLFAACTEKENTKYTITGSNVATEMNGDTIYIYGMDSLMTKRIALDSVVVVDGKFAFEGEITNGVSLVTAEFGKWWTKTPRIAPIDFVLEVGDITLSFDSIPVVAGTPANEKHQNFRETKRLYYAERQAKYKTYGEIKDDPIKVAAFKEESEALAKKFNEEVVNYIKVNIGTPVGAKLLTNEGYGLDASAKLDIIAQMPENLQLMKPLARMKANATAQNATAVGTKFADLKAKTADGKELALSDVAGKGKYVLVDFWASWCGPCIGEMPTLTKAYSTYKNKGFEIFAVSLDEDHEKWLTATKTHGVVWPQIIDPAGWGELANTYGVEGIPHTVLIDKDGTIIQKNIRGQALLDKLAELMK